MTSYFQVRLAFHHHTLVILAFCDKHRFSPSNTLDRFFSLPRHRSPGFGTNSGSQRPFWSNNAYISTIETKLPEFTGWSLIPKVRGANPIDSRPLLLVSCLASRLRDHLNSDWTIWFGGQFSPQFSLTVLVHYRTEQVSGVQWGWRPHFSQQSRYIWTTIRVLWRYWRITVDSPHDLLGCLFSISQ